MELSSTFRACRMGAIEVAYFLWNHVPRLARTLRFKMKQELQNLHFHANTRSANHSPKRAKKLLNGLARVPSPGRRARFHLRVVLLYGLAGAFEALMRL